MVIHTKKYITRSKIFKKKGKAVRKKLDKSALQEMKLDNSKEKHQVKFTKRLSKMVISTFANPKSTPN